MNDGRESDEQDGRSSVESDWERRSIEALAAIFAGEDHGDDIGRLLRALDGDDSVCLSDTDREVLGIHARMLGGVGGDSL